MKNPEKLLEPLVSLIKRRSFITKAGVLGVTAAATLAEPRVLRADGWGGDRDCDRDCDRDNTSDDTALEVFTAALIAEDLATTFYYNGLIGPVITDPNLAGTGGTATHIAANGNAGNVNYLQAALSEEITHANLLRDLTGGTEASKDPVQMFYLPNGTFDTLSAFIGVLEALENAFIGAYLNATIEFAEMAADSKAGFKHQKDASGKRLHSTDLEYYAQVTAAILGIESEHRVLGRVISNTNPANQLNYEQTDGLTSVYNGADSAVAALTPFLSPGAGKTAYSFPVALQRASDVSLPTSGGLPPAPKPKKDRDC